MNGGTAISFEDYRLKFSVWRSLFVADLISTQTPTKMRKP